MEAVQRGLLLLLAVLASARGCDMRRYEASIRQLCLRKFGLDMGQLESGLWCSWPHTAPMYEELTNCTFQVAVRLHCYWPNQEVDGFFARVHWRFFQDCALTGRLLHEPPLGVLAPFIAVPVVITLLMTALVVWRSKRTQGVL